VTKDLCVGIVLAGSVSKKPHYFKGVNTCNPDAPLMALLDVCQSVSPLAES